MTDNKDYKSRISAIEFEIAINELGAYNPSGRKGFVVVHEVNGLKIWHDRQNSCVYTQSGGKMMRYTSLKKFVGKVLENRFKKNNKSRMRASIVSDISFLRKKDAIVNKVINQTITACDLRNISHEMDKYEVESLKQRNDLARNVSQLTKEFDEAVNPFENIEGALEKPAKWDVGLKFFADIQEMGNNYGVTMDIDNGASRVMLKAGSESKPLSYMVDWVDNEARAEIEHSYIKSEDMGSYREFLKMTKHDIVSGSCMINLYYDMYDGKMWGTLNGESATAIEPLRISDAIGDMLKEGIAKAQKAVSGIKKSTPQLIK
ncbi:MAG: hypothetical protein LBM38_02300 [Clostridiales bacterium]|nr:hypothetical protein [Clostridiales bacterium]